MKPIIRVENLSKQYKIGAQQKPYSTIRESLVEAVRAPFKGFKRNGETDQNKFWALKDVNFEVQPGEVVGIIGRNGAGKSTLLKVLSRITEPTTGKVELYGRIGSLLEVGTGFHPELTGRENIFLNGAILGMKRDEIARKFEEIVDFAEVEDFLDTAVKHYSSGMYMRLAFAVAAHLEPEILIVDEVLAVGDQEFQKKCLGKMESVAMEGRTVLFVSHNMTAVSKLCTKGIYLLQGRVEVDGNIKETIQHYLSQNKSNEATFVNSPLKWASIKQLETKLILSVFYELDAKIEVPCLGFVISDSLGNPIYGSNPLLDKAELPSSPNNKGLIKTCISSPHLISGKYQVSLWFGDGKSDFVNEKDCLSFEVVNTSRKEQVFSVVGSVVPECVWFFQ